MTLMNTTLRCFTLVLLLAVAACGGGGDCQACDDEPDAQAEKRSVTVPEQPSMCADPTHCI